MGFKRNVSFFCLIFSTLSLTSWSDDSTRSFHLSFISSNEKVEVVNMSTTSVRFTESSIDMDGFAFYSFQQKIKSVVDDLGSYCKLDDLNGVNSIKVKHACIHSYAGSHKHQN
jgi:hypothetical protein